MGSCLDKPEQKPSSSSAEGVISTGTRFPVKNLDDQNRVVGEGSIEITETDLVLYSGTPEPVRWPLRYLRRYGFDQNLFSFEAGRRCPTGEGIYVFSTKHQEKIFKLVENNIRHGPKAPSGALDEDNSNGRNEDINGTGSRRPTQTELPSPSSPENIEKSLIPSTPTDRPRAVGLNYVKVDLDGVPPSAQKWPIQKAKGTIYTQLDLDKMKTAEQEAGAGKGLPRRGDQLNYVAVDFRGSVSSSAPPTAVRTPYTDIQVHAVGSTSRSGSFVEGSPNKGMAPSSPRDPIGYSKIDFEKTKAVTSLRPQSERE